LTYRLYVFDLDGTLVDSRRDLAEAANALLELCGGRPLPEEAIGQMVGEGAAALVARVFTAARIDAPPDALARFLTMYDRRLLEHTRPYPGIPDVLERLAARAPLAVLTNKPLAATRLILEGLGLTRYFAPDAVIGGDGPFERKPDPAGLISLMMRAGVSPPETLLIGDTTVDWQTARQGGAAMCFARYGFGFCGKSTSNGGIDHSIDAPVDLLKL
jgi:phosphoglycolate phosphatase